MVKIQTMFLWCRSQSVNCITIDFVSSLEKCPIYLTSVILAVGTLLSGEEKWSEIICCTGIWTWRPLISRSWRLYRKPWRSWRIINNFVWQQYLFGFFVATNFIIPYIYKVNTRVNCTVGLTIFPKCPKE